MFKNAQYMHICSLSRPKEILKMIKIEEKLRESFRIPLKSHIITYEVDRERSALVRTETASRKNELGFWSTFTPPPQKDFVPYIYTVKPCGGGGTLRIWKKKFKTEFDYFCRPLGTSNGFLWHFWVKKWDSQIFVITTPFFDQKIHPNRSKIKLFQAKSQVFDQNPGVGGRFQKNGKSFMILSDHFYWLFMVPTTLLG